MHDFHDGFRHHHGRDEMPFGPWAHLGRHAFRGGGQRARRGDVQPAILQLLAEKDMHGYQIIQELSERSGGAWSPSPGSIYPTLQLLEDRGLVTSRQEEGKRVFSLTDEGRAKAAEMPEEAPWDGMAGQGAPWAKVRDSMIGLVNGVHTAVRTGSPERIEKTVAILDEARKRVYAMLADDE